MNDNIFSELAENPQLNWIVGLFFICVALFYGAVVYKRIEVMFLFYYNEFIEISKTSKMKYTVGNFISRSKKYILVTLFYIFIVVMSLAIIVISQNKLEQSKNRVKPIETTNSTISL